MKEKLLFMPSLKDAFAIGMTNLVPIFISVLFWVVTIWIPYLNVGTTIAMATLPVKLSKGEIINPMFIFDAEYRHCMGEYFLMQAIIKSAVGLAIVFLLVPGFVLSFSWMLAVYLLVGKGMNWAVCLSESNRLMMGYKLKVFWLKFVVFVLIFGAAFSFYGILLSVHSVFLTALVFFLFVLVGNCILISIDAVVYRELVLNEENAEEVEAEETL